MRHNLHIRFNRSSELSHSETENLKRSTWEIDCPYLAIKSRLQDKHILYSGAGIIKQTPNGQIVFKLYSHRQLNAQNSIWKHSLEPGKMIPDHAFYDLVATDHQGREWHSFRLLPDVNTTAQGKSIIEGGIFELFCEGQLPRSVTLRDNSITFNVFNNIKIPSNEQTIQRKSVARGRRWSKSHNLNAWRFRVCGIDFLLEKQDDKALVINIHLEQKKTINHLETRVMEAFQFIFGQPVLWTAMYKRIGRRTKTVIRSQTPGITGTRFLAPLPPQGIVDPKTNRFTTAHHRRLFERFFKHIMRSDQMRHPLWGQLNAVYEASGGTFIDAQALALTVAIESILGSEFSKIGILKEKDKRYVDNARKYFEDWTGNEQIKNRIRGAVTQLLQSRAGDKMRDLAQRGAITENQVKAWQKLRNASAHSYQTSSIAHDEFVNLLKKIEVLFYHLIFYAIGYQGPYLDFSSPGWPIKQYPSNKD